MKLTQDNSLTLMNYKEPLTAIPKKFGYGYYGAIQVTLDGELMQCHLCGGLYPNVGLHAWQAHQTKAAEYKKMYKLAIHTALVSEAERERRKRASLLFWNSLTKKQREERKQHLSEGRIKWWKENPKGKPGFKGESLEDKNKKGTCPDQLKEKIRFLASVLGRSPRKSDFQKRYKGNRYLYSIKSTFGSFDKAVKATGLEPQKRFVYKEGKKTRYSDEELLDYLSICWKEQNKLPTESDFKRGFIPDPRIYRNRFGTMARARELAGIQ